MPVSKRRKRKRSARKTSQRAITPVKAVGPPADMRALESVTAGLARAMSGDRRDARSEQAQDLVYEAWEHDGPEREAIARRALDIHPDCADAHTILAEAADSLDEAILHYRRGVEAAERTLGSEPFEEDVGHFWGLFETRPYMRARGARGGALGDGRARGIARAPARSPATQ